MYLCVSGINFLRYWYLILELVRQCDTFCCSFLFIKFALEINVINSTCNVSPVVLRNIRMVLLLHILWLLDHTSSDYQML